MAPSPGSKDAGDFYIAGVAVSNQFVGLIPAFTLASYHTQYSMQMSFQA
jgi:hypothetical protein